MGPAKGMVQGEELALKWATKRHKQRKLVSSRLCFCGLLMLDPIRQDHTSVTQFLTLQQLQIDLARHLVK